MALNFKDLLNMGENLGRPVPIVPPKKKGFFTGFLDTIAPNLVSDNEPQTPPFVPSEEKPFFAGLLDEQSLSQIPEKRTIADIAAQTGAMMGGNNPAVSQSPSPFAGLLNRMNENPNLMRYGPKSPEVQPNAVGQKAQGDGFFAGLLDTSPVKNEPLPVSNLPKGADALSLTTQQENLPRSAPQKSGAILPRDERRDWQNAEQELYDAQNKDYSIQKDPNTGELIRGKDRDKNWTFWDKVGSTLLGALTGFGQGGLAGAIGGGIKAGTDRNYMEKLQNQMSELPKAQMRAEQARKAYETSLKLNGAENDETRAWRDDWRKSQKGLEDTHKAFLESLLEDDVFDENDSKAYFEMTGQKIAPFDKRKRETLKRNGDTVERPETGGGNWKPSVGVPTELVEKPVGVTQTNPDGKGFTTPMLPKDAANFRYRAGKDEATAQAQLDREKRREVVEAEKITFKSLQDWRKQTNAARSKYNAAQGAVRSLNPSIAEVEQQIKQYKGTYDTTDLEKRLDGLKKQQADYQREADEAAPIMNAERPASFTLPARQNTGKNINRKRTYSSSYIDSVIKQ